MNEIKGQMGSILDALVKNAKEESFKRGEEILKDIEHAKVISNYDDIKYFTWKLNDLIEYLIAIEYSNMDDRYSNILALEIKSNLLTHFFDKYFSSNEGSACSHDKTCHVIHRLLNHFRTNKVQEFAQSYDEETLKRFPDWKDKKPYWSPQTIFNTGEALELFKKWYWQRG